MNLVFQAGGLSVGEGAFLMACCNHTDDRGYVIASMQQLADESHMTDRNARNNKQRLIKRGLIAAADRYHPKTGARIADLYRVNLDLLGRMQRKRTDYGPTVVEELTFAASEETAGQTPRKILPPPPEDFAPPLEKSSAPPENPSGTPPEKSAPLLLPSSSPSSLSLVPGDADVSVATGPDRERESEATPNSVPVGVPVEGGRTGAVQQVVEAYAAAAGGRPVLASTRARLRGQTAELLAAGYPVEWLAARAAELPGRGWTDLVRHVERSRVPVPGQERREAPGTPEERVGLPAWCGRCGGEVDWDGSPMNKAVLVNARFRTASGEVDGEPCPDCHPSRVTAAC